MKSHTKLDEIILKPARWQYDDYQKAKAQIITLITEIAEEVINTKDADATWAQEAWFNGREDLRKQQHQHLKSLITRLEK